MILKKFFFIDPCLLQCMKTFVLKVELWHPGGWEKGVSTLPENFQTKENFEKIFCKFIPWRSFVSFELTFKAYECLNSIQDS